VGAVWVVVGGDGGDDCFGVVRREGGCAFGDYFLWIPASVPSGLRRNDEGGLGRNVRTCTHARPTRIRSLAVAPIFGVGWLMEIELLGKYVETGIRFAAGYWGGSGVFCGDLCFGVV